MSAPPNAAAEPIATPTLPSVAGTRAARPSRSAAVLALQAQALAQERFDAAALAVVDHLALSLACERVSFGLYVGARLRVVAVSGAADVRESSDAVARIAAAMSEALDQRAPIVHPLPSGASPAVTLAHQALAQANGLSAIYTVPVTTRHELLGALLFERHGGFDASSQEAAKDAAMFAGPLLALKHRADERLAPRVVQALRPQGVRRPFGATGGLPVVRIALALMVAAVAAAAFVPVTHHVVAPARIEGAVQQVIAAPVEGFVGSVAVRPGQTVKAGDVLAALDTRELALERDKWAAEMAQLDKQYREALSKDEAAPIVIARSKLEQAQSQHALALQQIERATLRAPMDGIVLSGDLTQSIGMPLKRGQELMTIAPDRSFRVVAEVEEQDIGALRAGQSAQVLFGALQAGQALDFAVARIAPVSTQSDGRNVFEVEGVPASAPEGLRPGMRGVARVQVGHRPLGEIWWERAHGALRRLAWRVLG